MLCQLSYAVRSVRVSDISEQNVVPSIPIFSVLVLCTQVSGEYNVRDVTLSVYWVSIPKVVGSIPTVAGHIFQARPVWIYTQSNITNIIFT